MCWKSKLVYVKSSARSRAETLLLMTASHPNALQDCHACLSAAQMGNSGSNTVLSEKKKLLCGICSQQLETVYGV